tara:strand:- start:105 stop:326 length:222 start_codon:yes stop_codon:yes gene_type:complete
MKKYLFGLGSMLVGAGLMFVFSYTEVSAESEGNKPGSFVCSRKYVGDYDIQHCETRYLDCAVVSGGLACVRKE